MAFLAGYGGQIKQGSNTLLTVTDWELDPSADMYETTVIGAGRAKTFLPGLYGATVALKINFDATDTNGAIALQGNLFSATPSALAFTLSPNGGTNNYTFNAYVKDMKIHNPVNNLVTADTTLQITGAVSYA